MITLPVNYVLVKSLKRWWDCEATSHRMYFLSGFLNHRHLRFVRFSGCMNKQLPEVLWRHETLLRVTDKWWTICCFCLRSDFWLVVRFWMTPPLFLTLHEPQSHPLGIAYTWSEKGARFDWKEAEGSFAQRERESEVLWGVETVSLLVNTLKVLCVGGGCGYVIG